MSRNLVKKRICEGLSLFQNELFWKITSFILAGFIITTAVIPFFQSKLGEYEGFQNVAIVKSVSASEIYPEFTCPCCGMPLDKEDPCCAMMTEMIDFIDSQVKEGKSEDKIYLATVKKFGVDRLAREEKRAQIKQILADNAPADAPKVVFKETSRDLGSVSQAKGEINTDFELENTGKSDLIINKLSSSCGCTSAAIIYNGKEGPRFTMAGHGKDNPTDWRVKIAPQDSAVLRVYYDPNVHKDLTGPVTRTVSVFSNDPVEFEKEITITLDQTP